MPKRSIELLVKPDLLFWARTSMGLDLPKVADKVKVKDDIIKNWESGFSMPTLVQAEKLARIYKRPLAVFFLPKPPIEPSLPQDFRTLPSEQAKPLSYETRLAIRHAWHLQSITLELADELDRTFVSMIEKIERSNDPEILATTARNFLKIGIVEQFNWSSPYEALHQWRRSVERMGVLVFQFSMPLEETRGFSLSSDKVPAIILNTRDVINARPFSLFHEFAHLLLNKSGICNMEMREFHEQHDILSVEEFCNHFAGSLLVPREALFGHEVVRGTHQPRSWTNEKLLRLSVDFKVSQEVILRRLLILGYTTPAFYRSKRDEWRRAALNKRKKKSHGGQSPSKKCVNENGLPFVSLVFDAYNSDKITYADVASYLGVRTKHIRKVAELTVSGG